MAETPANPTVRTPVNVVEKADTNKAAVGRCKRLVDASGIKPQTPGPPRYLRRMLLDSASWHASRVEAIISWVKLLGEHVQRRVGPTKLWAIRRPLNSESALMKKMAGDWLIGLRVEWLTILQYKIGSPTKVLAKCKCGTEKWFDWSNIKRGDIKSCGCWRREHARKIAKPGLLTDAELKDPLVVSTFTSWKAMINRCSNPKDSYYHRYGGRGIKVCKRWRNFRYFLEDIGPKPEVKLTLDRIDNDGNYEKTNCRWATREQQAMNRAKRSLPKVISVCPACGSKKFKYRY